MHRDATDFVAGAVARVRGAMVGGEGVTIILLGSPSSGVGKVRKAMRRRGICARGLLAANYELEQIQFLLGHASVLTTERYLGCKQNLEEPVNDRFGCLFSRTLDLR
jgi:hypothetical protein